MHRRRVVVTAVTCVIVLLAALAWAANRGYVSFFESCGVVEYGDPLPSYEELVQDDGLSPYCARTVRGENWL